MILPLRKARACAASAVLALILAGAEGQAGDRPTGPAEGTLWSAINAERARAGLAPLVLARPLGNAATGHAAYMAATGRFGHWGIGDGDPWSRAAAAGYRRSALAEVIAAGQADPASAVRDWMASPGHRAALLGDWSAMGGAGYRDRAGRLWWVVLVARTQ